MSARTGNGWTAVSHWDFDPENRTPGVLSTTFWRSEDCPEPGSGVPFPNDRGSEVRVHYSLYHKATILLDILVATMVEHDIALATLRLLENHPPLNNERPT